MFREGDVVRLRPLEELTDKPYYDDSGVLGICHSSYIAAYEMGEHILSWLDMSASEINSEHAWHFKDHVGLPDFYFVESMFALADDNEPEINPVDIEAFLSIIG